MDKYGHIYELDEEAQRAILGEPTKIPDEELEQMKQDVARLEGYLKGRADSDRPKRGARASASEVGGMSANRAT